MRLRAAALKAVRAVGLGPWSLWSGACVGRWGGRLLPFPLVLAFAFPLLNFPVLAHLHQIFVASVSDALKLGFRQVPQVGGVDVVAALDALVDVGNRPFGGACLVGVGPRSRRWIGGAGLAPPNILAMPSAKDSTGLAMPSRIEATPLLNPPMACRSPCRSRASPCQPPWPLVRWLPFLSLLPQPLFQAGFALRRRWLVPLCGKFRLLRLGRDQAFLSLGGFRGGLAKSFQGVCVLRGF